MRGAGALQRGRIAAERSDTVPGSDAPDRSALAADLDRQLSALADTLTWLADDLEADHEVAPSEVQRATDRVAAATDGLRFSQITASLDVEPT